MSPLTPGAPRAAGVLTALEPRWDGSIVAALETSGQVRIARRCADLADLLATAASGLGSLALVSAQLRGLSLSDVARLRDGGVEVIGISDPADESTELRLWQLGVHAVVRADSPEQVLEAVLAASPGAEPSRWAGGAPLPPPPAEVGPGGATPFGPFGLGGGHPSGASGTPPLGYAASAAPESASTDRGRIVAVWGPAGAPGRTTIAVNLAAELAVLGRQVLLVDADTYGGAVAQSLSVLDEAPGLVAATRAADQGTLDLTTLARLSPQVWPGLRLLTGIPKAERWPELRGAALERVLEVARSLAEVVVVDVGFCLEDDEELSYDTLAPRRNQATLTTLEVADELLVVGGCDPVSLQRLVRAVQELGAVRAPLPVVVVNRARAGAVGGPPQRHVGAALARFAGVEDVVYVPDDGPGCDAAMFSGRSLAEAAPGSPARRAIGELAARVAGVGYAGGRPPRHTRSRRRARR